MALSATAITPVNDPNSLDSSNAASKVYPPQSGTSTTSNDIGANLQILRNQTHTLNEVKYAKAGGIITGLVDINQATVNGNALEATGNGTGEGAVITGGATGRGASIQAGGGNNIGAYCVGAGTGPGVSALGGATGSGVVAVAGGGNNYGVDATGTGTASGVTATGGATGNGGIFAAGGGNANGIASTGAGTGSGVTCTGGTTGPGLTATPGTAQTNTAPTCAARFAGYIQLTGTDPNAGVDPGANNVLHAANIIKAWCTLDSSYAIRASYNVDTITTVLGDIKKLTFKRAMADNTYGVKIHVHGTTVMSGSHNGLANKNAGDFQFVLYRTDTGATGIGSADEVYIEVTGMQ
jgi:hypothetical protein